MTYLAVVFAVLAGLLHVAIFAMESLAWTRPQTWRRFGVASQADADTTRPLAFNQGFYNLFLAVAALAGAGLVLTDATEIGWTLIVTACGSMLAAAVVLLSTGAAYLRAAVTQGLFPALSLVAALVVLL